LSATAILSLAAIIVDEVFSPDKNQKGTPGLCGAWRKAGTITCGVTMFKIVIMSSWKR
jgi:hypothetical protein